MGWRRLVLFGSICLLAVGIEGLGLARARAASNAPTVSIRRNPIFVGRVLSGDFNGDGIPDLAGSTHDPANPSGPVLVTVALGNGDGTFGAPIRTNRFGTVFAVGDFNHDGKLDVLEQHIDVDEDLLVLAGNGDGTFGAGGIVTTTTQTQFAMAADLDGDGNLDVVVACFNETAGGPQNQILIVHGNGDLTFDSMHATVVPAMPDPMGGAIADLNGDGRKDIVIANREEQSLTMLRNQGSLAFAATEFAVPHDANDVAAADLNGDGRIDLVVAGSDGGDPGFHVGYATVLLGTGGGSFAAPVDYPTAPGAWNVVIDDFNRDGVADIATANRSSIYFDALCWPFQTWDSVSILPGTTSGTFTARSDFSIGNQMKPQDKGTDQNKVSSLVSGDLNGDHAPDLIVSNGTLFLNHAADPNWAPTVDAGPDQTVNDPGDHFVHLFARANDVDQDMLSYRWIDSGGDSIPPVPSPCFSPHTLGVHTYTVTVDDGHGHTASDSVQVDFGPDSQPPTLSVTAPAAGEVVPAGHPYVIRWTVTPGTEPIQQFDLIFSPDDGFTTSFIDECRHLAASATSCQWNNPPVTESGRIQVLAYNAAGDTNAAAKSGLFAVRTTTTSGLPAGWSHADIGSVGAAGSATSSAGDSFTVTGAGSDIWGTADHFHYAWTMMAGDFEVNARVDSIQNVNAWTKAGVMIRETSAAGSRHASLFGSAGKGLAFQRRPTANSASVSTAGPMLTAPVWVRLTRRGNLIIAYYRKAITHPWTKVGDQTLTGLAQNLMVGLAVSSHVSGTTATASFSQVRVGALPAWAGTPVGNQGSFFTDDDTVFNVIGRGNDFWGTGDEGYFLWTPLDGDGSISARVRSIQNTNAWAKAGVMIRETLLGNSQQVDMIVSAAKGVTMQYRDQTGGQSASVIPSSTASGPIPGTAPGWVRLTRSGNTFVGEWSTDGVNWTRVGEAGPIAMDATIYIGLAVTSHDRTVNATGVFDDVVVKP